MLLKVSVGILCVAAVACGGGGSDEETGYAFLDAVPNEQVLCSFVVGETTQAEVMDVLGEPTHFNGDALGSFLQYWVGSVAETATSGLRSVAFSFDSQGVLDAPSVTQIPFPECWREQLAARDAAGDP